MPRIHLFEFGDQTWCPALLRDAGTDLLGFALNLGGHYRCAVPKLQAAMATCGTRQIVDLCSGAGGPWPSLLKEFAAQGDGELRLTLTDRFPNLAALRRLQGLAPGRVDGPEVSVDALHMPAELPGFRTLFTAFHHFHPEGAQAILADAVGAGQGIGIFEVTQRSPLGIGIMLLTAPMAALLPSFLPPWRPSRLLLIPLLPIVALMALWDGLVSCLRTYSPDELRALVATLPEAGYTWDIGTLHYWSGWSLTPVTYLIGTPPRQD